MARNAGITQEQVNLAAAELAAAGKTPGVRNVRELLGTGSNQTVQAMLQNWQKSQPAPQAADMPVEALPGELVQVLQAALSNAKTSVAAEFQEAIALAHAQRDRAAQDALEQYAEFERQQTLSAELSRKGIELDAKNQELQKQVDALSDSDRKRQVAESRAAAAEAKVVLLEPLPTKVQALESAATTAADAHAKALSDLKAAHAAELAKAQAEAKASAEKAAAEHAKTQQELATTAQALAKAQTQGVETGAMLKAAEARISGLSTDLSEAQKGKKTAEDKAADAALELSNAQGRISVLQEQAAKVETLQERVFKLQAMLPPAEAEKTAQKPSNG